MTWLDEITAIGRLVKSVPRALPNSSWTMTRVLEKQASRAPDDPALAYLDREYTWGEIDQHSNRWAHTFLDEGIQPGDIVALVMDNRPEYLFAVHGLAKIGAAAALINTNLTGQPLTHAITVGNSRKVVAGDEHAAAVDEVISELGCLDTKRSVLLHVQDTTQPRPGGGALLNEAVHSAQTSKPDVTFDANSESLFCYIYTSGTTGLPKAAVISHRRAMLAGVGAAHLMMRLKSGHVSYVALPLYHSSAMFVGWSAVLNSGAGMALRRKFSVTHFWDDVRQYNATHSVYIGELCRYLLNGEPSPSDRDHNLRCVMGNGLRPDIWHEFQERFGIPEIREFYGATEGTAGLMNRSGKPGMVGKIGPGMKLVACDQETGDPIRGDDGFCTQVKPGEIGLLLGPISKATSFDGYVDKAASEKKIMTDVLKPGDRFFNTGDLLQLHEGKWLSFADRVGDTFRWKGENVSTNEVAEVCNCAPGVLETNVYGVQIPGADGRAGMAAVNADDSFDIAAFAGFVGSALPGYQRPLFVRLLSGEMQTTGTFKHQKVRYRNEAFDPSQCEDPLYYFDGASYQPIDAAVFDAIGKGEIRVG